MHQRDCHGNYVSKPGPSELRSVHAKGLGIRVDTCTHIAVDRSHGTNPVRPRGQNVHVAHGEWPMVSEWGLQLRRLNSSGSALRRLRRRFLPVARAAPPHTRATGQVSREGPAAHLQPPVRARGSTSQVATAKLWCRSRGATKLVVSAPPQGIASQAADLVLPATPKGGASAPAPEVVTGSVLLRHVQEARREQKEYTRLPGATRSATFW